MTKPEMVYCCPLFSQYEVTKSTNNLHINVFFRLLARSKVRMQNCKVSRSLIHHVPSIGRECRCLFTLLQMSKQHEKHGDQGTKRTMCYVIVCTAVSLIVPLCVVMCHMCWYMYVFFCSTTKVQNGAMTTTSATKVLWAWCLVTAK